MLSLDAIDLWVGVASLLFPLWPLMMLMPLTANRRSRRSGPNLAQFLMVWLLAAILRVSLFLFAGTTSSFLLPEPSSTILFSLVGVFLFALLLRRQRGLSGTLWRAAGEANRPDDLLVLSPRQFEEMVVELYRALGHDARRTGAIGDHGVDVVVNAKNGEKWVVQCKRWRGNVGEPIIRDFYGVVHHEKADKGTIITTGGYTAKAREWAKGKPLTLVDGPQFLKYVKRAREMKKVGAGESS